jgi:hypothetical protein
VFHLFKHNTFFSFNAEGRKFYFDSLDAELVVEFVVSAVLPVLLPFGPADPMTSASYWLECPLLLFVAEAGDCFAHNSLRFAGTDMLT